MRPCVGQDAGQKRQCGAIDLAQAQVTRVQAPTLPLMAGLRPCFLISEIRISKVMPLLVLLWKFIEIFKPPWTVNYSAL